MSNDSIIKVNNLTKIFKLPHEKYATAKQHFVNIFNPKGYEVFKALDSVSFEIKKGEFFGIIGSNGSGKSTLLKLLAQIYQPTSGSIEINGSLSPFIELGVGFNPELTARDNIYLNAAILGMTRKQTDEKFDEIVSFSELENFLDQKLKNFSSGMQVRLAFSIAVQAQADILIVDEVLAVGDASFQQKCLELFRRLKKEGKTIIFVSHALNIIEEFCDNCILVKKGKVKFQGNPKEAVVEYMKLNIEEEKGKIKKESLKHSIEENNLLKITSVICLDKEGNEKNNFSYSEDFGVKIQFKNKRSDEKLNFGVAIYKEDGTYCYGTNTFLEDLTINKDLNEVKLNYSNVNLLPSSYYFIVGIYGNSPSDVKDFKVRADIFRINGESSFGEGTNFISHTWGFK